MLRSLFLINPEGLQLYLKETPTQVFSCKLCDIFKNAYFEEHVRTASFTLNLIFKTSTAHFVYFLLDRLCFSLYSLIHVINFFLMTSFPYIFPCPFTLLHLLPTAQMLQAHTKIFRDKNFWEPNKQHLKLYLVLVTACSQPLHRYKQILPTN